MYVYFTCFNCVEVRVYEKKQSFSLCAIGTIPRFITAKNWDWDWTGIKPVPYPNREGGKKIFS